MAAAEAALSGGDGGRHVGAWRFPCVIASAASKRVGSPDTFDWVIARGFSLVAIKRVGILCLLVATLAALARNDKRSATKVVPPNHQKKRAQSYGEATAQRRFEYCDF